MKEENRITRGQLMTMATVGLFTPVVRLLPNRVAVMAGPAAWLAPLAALPLVALGLWGLTCFFRSKADREGLGEMILRALGRPAGRLVLLLYGLWLLYYSGFILRSSNERFLSSVYEDGQLSFFMIPMMALVLMGALGKLRTLARSSQLFLVGLIGVLGAIFLFSASEVSIENLLPVSILDADDVFLAAIPVVNTLSPWVYMTFLSGAVEQEPGRFKSLLKWSLLQLFLLFLLIITTVGNFGATLAGRMQNPFFAMVRDVRVFDLLERIEVVVIILWVVTDFVFLSSLLMSSAEALRLAAGKQERRIFVWVGAVAVLVIAYMVAPDAFALTHISEFWIPVVNMAFVFALLPLIWAVGKIRKKF